MDVTHSFATRLKELREEKGLNQGQLAKELGISRGSISYYENEERTPDIEIFDRIARYFNVSVEYMLGYISIKNTVKTDIKKILKISDNTLDTLIENNVKDERLNDVISEMLFFLSFEHDLLINIEELALLNLYLIDVLEGKETDKSKTPLLKIEEYKKLFEMLEKTPFSAIPTKDMQAIFRFKINESLNYIIDEMTFQNVYEYKSKPKEGVINGNNPKKG